MGFGKDGKGVIIREIVTLTAGALGVGAAVKHTGGATLETTPFRILKTEYFVTIQGNFGAEGDEVIVGMCDGELSTTEIANCLGANGPGDRNNHAAHNNAMLPVWTLSQHKEAHDAATSYHAGDVGKITFNPKWTFGATEGWSFFAYNPLAGSLTSGLVLRIHAKHYGVWVV